jgi:hypothetical protein
LGCVSFGDFSLHKQRKVTRSPAGRVEALHFQRRKKIKMDSRLRGNDGNGKRRRWIPAFAGMTSIECYQQFKSRHA